MCMRLPQFPAALAGSRCYGRPRILPQWAIQQNESPDPKHSAPPVDGRNCPSPPSFTMIPSGGYQKEASRGVQRLPPTAEVKSTCPSSRRQTGTAAEIDKRDTPSGLLRLFPTIASPSGTMTMAVACRPSIAMFQVSTWWVSQNISTRRRRTTKESRK